MEQWLGQALSGWMCDSNLWLHRISFGGNGKWYSHSASG